MTTKKLFTQMNTNDVVGENRMPANSTTGAALVDLFFFIGAARHRPDVDIQKKFAAAIGEDALLALKVMFYARDIRGGMGERRAFRVMFRYLCEHYPEVALANLRLVPEYGRWDDLFVAEGTAVEARAFSDFLIAVIEGNGLAAKWAPREGKRNHRLAMKLARIASLTPRKYRQLLAGNTEVVESLMCDKRWRDINYSHVSSVAIMKYRRAWLRNDPDRYKQWLADIKAGRPAAKINAGAIHPHTILQPIFNKFFRRGAGVRVEELQQLQHQWDALPDYVPQGLNILPMVDVSPSMRNWAGDEPMQVSMALGLYVSERQEGPYHNAVLTFAGNPTFVYLKGENIYEKYMQLKDIHWHDSTNFEAALKLILNSAKQINCKPEFMPQVLLVLSDMQFDRAAREAPVNGLDLIKSEYAEAGYEMPIILFWNLRAAIGFPAQANDGNVIMVSGFSPAVMKSVLSNEITPLHAVLHEINTPRYAEVTLPE